MPRQVDRTARLALVADAVVALAVDHGFPAVTIRAVAERIGASTSAVTHYVGGREDMLRIAIRREVDARRAQGEAAVGDARGMAALRALLEWAALVPDERTQRFWLALVVGSRDDPVVRAELDAFNIWWDALLRNLLADTAIADHDTAVDVLDVLADGLVLTGFDEGRPWSAARRSRVLTVVWQALAQAERTGRPLGSAANAPRPPRSARSAHRAT
ncbi:TetR/AcrR family transcriptional regulator [Nocardia sp. CDC159]|uniref:TetR/AcrR family transcriptional regulator n=1 Tax=Nocardia pulmonis TaxID=2951408 RepID=A0A9X2E5K6_9NOCA|nr:MULTISPECIES: TetR/AcrR family transcriptional regulator [Nocardia]MCM6773493.1 TetR/AcrR family transcriptional regulator [Nocardia pulmonis]MCM6786380.1 TetR/AcrR family transcriptional regulator [Nocardia sp. CDC159]